MLITTLNKERGAETMTSLAQSWKEEGIQDGIKIGKQDGIKIGEARGEAKGRLEIAHSMLLDGDSVQKIVRITGISVSEIERLKT